MSNDSTDVENPLLRAALEYAERGWPVFPLVPGTKRPATPRGFKDATIDEAKIRAWWKGNPAANVGIATGARSGLFVVDEDPGGAEPVAALGLPLTHTVRTPRGGRHYYLSTPAGVKLSSSAGRLGEHVDTRGDGGYVVAPPSIVDGKPYTVEFNVPIVAVPQAIVERLAPKPPSPPAVAGPTTTTRSGTYAKSALEREAGAVLVAAEGNRNDRLNRAAHSLGQLVTEGSLDESVARQKLTAAGLAAGLDKGEVSATVASGLQAGKQHPRDEPWTPPTPLSDVPVPAFPVDVLPPVLAHYVSDLAEATQTPADLPALVVLAVAACACARRIDVEAAPGWVEPVNLYTLACLPSGSRKSAVFSEAVRPLQEAEHERVERAMPAIAEAASARRILEGQLREVEARAAKALPDKRDGLVAEAAELARRVAETPIPTAPRLMVDDATSEALASALEANGERLGMFSAEGGIFDLMAGRYSKNGAPNIDVYLKGHAGDRLRVDRIGRPPVELQRPALTMGLTIQPDVLRGMFAQPSFRGRGLCARFLYAVPPSNIGARDVNAAPVSPAARAAFNRAIRGIVDADWPAAPALVPLSEEARAAFQSWRKDHERSLGRDNALEHLADWGSKLPGAVVRLAGIFHALAGDDDEVSASTIERTIALAPYLVAHAKAAHAMMGADPEVEGARAILRHLERKGIAEFSRRELFNDLRGLRFPRVDALDAPLALLEAHGHIRADGSPAPSARGGRPASARYQVNPFLFGERSRGA